MNDTPPELESPADTADKPGPVSPVEPDDVPLCLHCLEAVSVLDHYCPHCGEAVGQYTPNIPFVNIGFQISFWERLWGRLWTRQEMSLPMRLFSLLLVIITAPIMLVGLPFVMLAKWRRSTETGDEA